MMMNGIHRCWYRIVRLAVALAAASAWGAPGAGLPDLEITLGRVNQGRGLRVPSGGDGCNEPGVTPDGTTFRRISPGSSYLYVRIDSPAYEAAAPLDLYVIAELLDDDFHLVTLQYDKEAETPSIATMYTRAGQTVILTGRSGIRKVCFFLPRARIGHGENHGTDFRFQSAGLAVHRIVVTPRRPSEFRPQQGVDPESLAALRVERPPGMELTFGSDASESMAAVLHALSATSVESYVTWTSVEPEKEGEWDWSRWDKQVDILRRHGLKWVPFLIAGPAYATPKWFHDSPHSRYFVCLEHGRASKVQSIFNPDLPHYVRRFIRAFAERYRDSGIIESVLLGVTGIYGESIYPAGPEGGWTAEYTGPYHNHAGWWAGDGYAVRDFQRTMHRKYWFLGRLNRAWGVHYTSWNDVRPFLPDRAPSDRARADMVKWYQNAMTSWAAFWVRTARRYFPHTEIYLCTGGNGNPMLGADFTAQAKAIAPWNAGIRITNEASDFAANFTITREVATATRLYGTFAGFEPAGRVDPKGVVARIFNATTSGARQLHFYHPNVLQSGEALRNFQKYIHLLVPRRPVVSNAFYVSRESWEIAPETISPMYACARRFRDVTDYDMVTRRSVRDGALDGRRSLLLVHSPVIEPAVAKRLAKWVRRGGILIAAAQPGELPGSRLYDLDAWRKRLFAPPTHSARRLLRRRLDGDAPAVWRLELGAGTDTPWIFGDWHGPERALEWPDLPGARKRWSGSRPGILLPVRPGAGYTLRLDAYLAKYSVKPTGNTVRINGIPIGRLDREGRAVYTFHVPPGALEASRDSGLARLEIDMNTWVPKEHGGSTDARTLGVALHTVLWKRDGAPADARPGTARIRCTVNSDAFHWFVRRVERGWTVFLPDVTDNPETLAGILQPLFRNTPDFLPGVKPLAPEDGRLDNRFAVRTQRHVLRYDADSASIELDPPAPPSSGRRQR